MKAVRIRQLEKLVRALQADGYTVNPIMRPFCKRLLITINLSPGEAEDIMAKWNDLKGIE
ncbi:unnamed protein product [marine sediment metagenome]|uniref:Uncharacterized protein n=1 Tax=marine sediment metagenome TaxID=412755 RepID=X1A606_9ZZZZ